MYNFAASDDKLGEGLHDLAHQVSSVSIIYVCGRREEITGQPMKYYKQIRLCQTTAICWQEASSQYQFYQGNGRKTPHSRFSLVFLAC